VFGQFLGNLQD